MLWSMPLTLALLTQEVLEGSLYLVQGSPIPPPPAAQSDLLDLLPVGSAFFGFLAAPVLLDLAGVPDPAWWQTVSAWADAGSFDATLAAAAMTGCVAAAA